MQPLYTGLNITVYSSIYSQSTHDTIHQYTNTRHRHANSAQSAQSREAPTDTTRCTPTTVHYSRSLPGQLSHGSAREALAHCCYQYWHQLSQSLQKRTMTHQLCMCLHGTNICSNSNCMHVIYCVYHSTIT